MALSKLDAPVYTDLTGLAALRKGAGQNDPQAIRKVAQQFESLFTRMMLKSMRDAVGTDPLFGSDQQQMYQGMADDQLALEMSKGRGLGLADMLIKQLHRMGVKGADPSTQKGPAGPRGLAAYTATQRAGNIAATQGPGSAAAAQPTNPVSEADRADFVRDLWPHAQEAGRQLGVDPRNLIAQAALETNWGQNVPPGGTGRSSNNLFGIKASSDWNGASVASPTIEFQDGVQNTVNARFRAYSTPGQSFADYVALLRANPRYSGALNTGADVRAFAAALQRGGYATDPDYASKISALAHRVNGALTAAADLKLADAQPITSPTGML